MRCLGPHPDARSVENIAVRLRLQIEKRSPASVHHNRERTHVDEPQSSTIFLDETKCLTKPEVGHLSSIRLRSGHVYETTPEAHVSVDRKFGVLDTSPYGAIPSVEQILQSGLVFAVIDQRRGASENSTESSASNDNASLAFFSPMAVARIINIATMASSSGW